MKASQKQTSAARRRARSHPSSLQAFSQLLSQEGAAGSNGLYSPLLQAPQMEEMSQGMGSRQDAGPRAVRRKPSLTNARGSITERLNMPTSAGTLAPQASTGGGDDDAYSVTGSPSRLNLRSPQKERHHTSPGTKAAAMPRQHQRSSSMGRLAPQSASSQGWSDPSPVWGGGPPRRAKTPGSDAVRTPPAYKLDPHAALDLASGGPGTPVMVSTAEIGTRQYLQDSRVGRRPMSLSTSDLRNADFAVERDPAAMRGEIRRLRNALVELYRGPNKLVGGSQFRTLIRDTDAPYNCSECDGLKAFIRNLQREQRALRDHCEDLELKLSRTETAVERMSGSATEAHDFRQQNEALQASLSQRECEVDALQQEVERLMGLDRAADPSEESRRLEQAMEIKQLRDQLKAEKTRHSLEQSHTKHVMDQLDAQAAALRQERADVAARIARIRRVELADLQGLPDELTKIQEELDMRRAESSVRAADESELAALRKAARESEASLQLAQRELSKAREQVDTLTESRRLLQGDFDKVMREKETLSEALKQETESVRRGMEALMNSSSVRVCVVAPSVTVQVPQHKAFLYKSSVSKEKIRGFVEGQVLPRFVSLFIQDDEGEGDKKNNSGRDGKGGGQGSGLDVWVETMLMEIKTVVEGSITRIFHEE